MHVKDQRAFGIKTLVEDKILECDAVATELNLNQLTMNVSEDTMDLPEGKTLQSILSPKAYKKIDNLLFKQTGLRLHLFNTSLPMFISNVLAESILAKEMPYSLDQSIWNFAQEQEKYTLGIETFEEQIAVLKTITIDQQVKGLLAIAKNFKSFRKQTLKIVEIYQTGNIQAIFKHTKKGAKGMRKIMLYNRNIIMADRISEIIQEQTTFCAIGASHLGGKKGVLNLLKQDGFKIKPVHASDLFSKN